MYCYSASLYGFTFDVLGGQSVANISDIKLEEGPNQTLAYQDSTGAWHRLPQPEDGDYVGQLLKCQRYLQLWQFDNTYETIPCSGVTGTTTQSVRVSIPLPVPLRTAPSVEFSSGLYVFALNDGEEMWLKITGVQWTQIYGNTVRIAFIVAAAAPSNSLPSVSLPVVGIRAQTTSGEYLRLNAQL